MNKLAEALGMDPGRVAPEKCAQRWQSMLTVQSPMPPGVSIGAVIEECAKGVGWQAPLSRKS